MDPEIVFHGMERLPHVEARARERAERLEKFGRLISCRVVIDAPQHRRHTGDRHEVRLEVTLPGARFAVGRDPGDRNAHKDVLVALRDAFDAMERQLARWKQLHSGRPEVHAAPLQGRVAEIDGGGEFGQVSLPDGRLIYFHRNSMGAGGFDALSVGDPVEVALGADKADEGPHASFVRPISDARFVDAAG